MAEPQNQDLIPQVNSEVSIDAMISAPLVAASKANAEMVLGQTNFLLRNCFAQVKVSPATESMPAVYKYDPIMIQMSLTRSVIDTNKLPSDEEYMKIETMDFSIPLLCIIPINSLAIDNVTVDFDMEVTSISTWEIKSDDLKNGNRVLNKQAQLNGKISSDPKTTGDNQYKKQSSSRLKVHINASPLPLPLGVLSILDLYSKNINPVPTKRP